MGALTSCDRDVRIYAKELKAERLLVEDYIEFSDQDVLFLYSTFVVDQSAMLR